ncbi:MAG: IspD/TarI family cytidylyltransferase [Actinomycetota bacterium]
MHSRLAVVLLAAGSGSRFGGEANKVLQDVGGHPLLWYPLDTLRTLSVAGSLTLAKVVVVMKEEHRGLLSDLLASFPDLSASLVLGGPTRHQSEANGIDSMADDIVEDLVDLVAVHDGARPFMSSRLLTSCLQAADRVGGAVPGLPAPTPLFSLDGPTVKPGAGDNLFAVQTPQVFRSKALLAAYRAADREGVDTSETVERFGSLSLEVVPADPRNIKVTYPSDVVVAEGYARRWRSGAWLD